MPKTEFDDFILEFEKMGDDTILKEFSVENNEKIQRDKQLGLEIYKVMMLKLSDGKKECIAIQSYPPSKNKHAPRKVPYPYRRNKRLEEDSRITDIMIMDRFTNWMMNYKNNGQ